MKVVEATYQIPSLCILPSHLPSHKSHGPTSHPTAMDQLPSWRRQRKNIQDHPTCIAIKRSQCNKRDFKSYIEPEHYTFFISNSSVLDHEEIYMWGYVGAGRQRLIGVCREVTSVHRKRMVSILVDKGYRGYVEGSSRGY